MTKSEIQAAFDMYIAFMTPWKHMITDVKVGERLFLGDTVIEVTEIGAGFITVKSDRDYTFQRYERI